MAFKFIPSGNKLVKNHPILWKFETRETVYQSEQERFERNVEYWRRQNGLSSTERVVTLNGEFQPIEYTPFEEIKEELDDATTIDYELVSEPVSDLIDPQPSVSECPEDIIDTPKRKSRKKASDV